MGIKKVDDLLHKIREDGYKPTKEASRLIKLLGPELSANAYAQGAITLKCNDDKTFDIIIGKELTVESVKRLEVALLEKGYGLTVKGKKYVQHAYNDGSFTYGAFKRVKENVMKDNV
ncbi:hypothetical protein CL622_07590 [archaeon]|nr:hypothetical protein [archaeon]|tara:strand:+ start:5120 stop:5470 length:351 start_codon:yes stop_codon:yes gene_type:complete